MRIRARAPFFGALILFTTVEENPDIDLFFFPKTQVKKYNVFHDGPKYLWWQKADVNSKVKGATIKVTE